MSQYLNELKLPDEKLISIRGEHLVQALIQPPLSNAEQNDLVLRRITFFGYFSHSRYNTPFAPGAYLLPGHSIYLVVILWSLDKEQ
jgi:hypothetical protein